MKKQTLLAQYHIALHAQAKVYDEAQAAVITALDVLYLQLLDRHRLAQTGWRRFWPFKQHAIKGLYIWGGVGRGKTYVMDLFYHHVPFTNKWRVHFYQFMQQVHLELKSLEGLVNPVNRIAEQMAKKYRLICFDEFFVKDITDAMLLGNLLSALFANGVCLVVTSNVAPDELYKDGLQRALFLPAIEVLKKHMQVLNIDGDTDYRWRQITLMPHYYCPLDNEQVLMQKHFHSLAMHQRAIDTAIVLHGREIKILARTDSVIWFNFYALCGDERGQDDYLSVAKQYRIVLISHVPRLTDDLLSYARRFIILIDVLYDNHIKLVMSAEVPIEQLYGDGHLAFDFQRITSRLRQMQTQAYWDRV